MCHRRDADTIIGMVLGVFSMMILAIVSGIVFKISPKTCIKKIIVNHNEQAQEKYQFNVLMCHHI